MNTALEYYDDGEERAVLTVLAVAKDMARRPLTTEETDAILRLVGPFMLKEFPDWELNVWIGDILARSGVDADGRS